jgi:hypothetical protein
MSATNLISRRRTLRASSGFIAIRKTFEPAGVVPCVLPAPIGAPWIKSGHRQLLAWDRAVPDSGRNRLHLRQPPGAAIIVTAYLVSSGYAGSLSVRSTFYDHPLSGILNGLMRAFAMYPPIFARSGPLNDRPDDSRKCS